MIPVFDGHNDTLLLHHRHPERDLAARQGDGHLDLVRAREGGFAGGFFAVFPPTPAYEGDGFAQRRPRGEGGYEVPPAGPVPFADATAAAHAMTAQLHRWHEAGLVRLVRSVAEIETAREAGVVAAILHYEGAEAIGPDLQALEVYRQAGLRSLGVVWSRPNPFGHGVPFSFPGSPDAGPGLTALGRALVRRCNELGILVDVSHITERGFWDVAEVSSAPLVATHSNAHAVCPSPRNLTDAQLDAVRASDGMVGLNFATAFLDPEGRDTADVELDVMVRHVDHLVDRLGVSRVGFGSDFDGATVPAAIGDVAGVPRLLDALADHGYDEASLRALAYDNWLRVLRATWGA